MTGTVHVVGAGMAGLACAVALAARGRPVALYEAAAHGGGRCRSFWDDRLGREVDNGNHLILTGNRAVATYVAPFGAAAAFWNPPRAAFPFLDMRTGRTWTVEPGPGLMSWRLLAAAGRLYRAREGDTVSRCLGGSGTLYERFWHPLALAVLNTDPAEAAARPLWPVLRETFGRGEEACRPRIARRGLSDALVVPAVAWLRGRGVAVRFAARLRAIGLDGQRVSGLGFGEFQVAVREGEAVVLAVPPWMAAKLLPGLIVPRAHRPIVNAHFRLPAGDGGTSLLGILGGTAQWVFRRDGLASVTVSAATDLVDRPSGALAAALWQDVAKALDLPERPLPPCRVVKERRATFAQTPAELRRRPGPRTPWRNLLLAGDWTDTGLPATIEGAVRSGQTAAAMVCAATTSP